MAAILFADIVDYSQLADDLQGEVAQGLNEECARFLLPAFRAQRMGAARIAVVAMPTGDGVVVCLDDYGDVRNPGLQLLDLAFALQNWGRTARSRSTGRPLDVHFRIGLDSGKLLPIEDVNQLPNVCGRHINLAQRVMDCGDPDHILCSADAYHMHLSAAADTRAGVCIHELESYYTIKHGEALKLHNITRRDATGLVNGREQPPDVKWKCQVFPYKTHTDRLIHFQNCEHLTVVGVTNDRIAPALYAGCAGDPKGRTFPRLKQIDLFYASEQLFRFMPPQEHAGPFPDAVGGNPDRDPDTLRREQAESRAVMARFRAERPDVGVNLYEYAVVPMAGIAAGDARTPDGVIQVTHSVPGRMSGSCPTMILRRRPLPDIYQVYVAYLDHLYKAPRSIPLPDTPATGRPAAGGRTDG